MKKFALAVVVLVVIAGGYWLMKKQPAQQTPDKQSEETKTDQAKDVKNDENTEKNAETAGQTATTTKETVETDVKVDVQTVQEISMTSGYAFFTPKVMTLKKGQPVKITMQNKGKHNFQIDELGVSKDLPEGTSVVEFTPQTEGVFIYYCSIPGHRQAGQWGTVTVEE